MKKLEKNKKSIKIKDNKKELSVFELNKVRGASSSMRSYLVIDSIPGE